MMSADLAFVAARVGCEVVLADVSESALNRARGRIQALVKRESRAGDAVLARVHPTLDLVQHIVEQRRQFQRR